MGFLSAFKGLSSYEYTPVKGKGKGKAVPLQAWTGGFQKVKVPRFRGNGAGCW